MVELSSETVAAKIKVLMAAGDLRDLVKLLVAGALVEANIELPRVVEGEGFVEMLGRVLDEDQGARAAVEAAARAIVAGKAAWGGVFPADAGRYGRWGEVGQLLVGCFPQA
ncbi:hypothetical protein V8J38_16820 (plasmid) [Brevundimonas olei]|uniref:Uncharacterized protein n=1 Tax=Brevundimonas olei TaxID=657642 RepID=A0ABZ2IME7_9CAUL